MVNQECEGAPGKGVAHGGCAVARGLAAKLVESHLYGAGSQHGGAATPPVKQTDRERRDDEAKQLLVRGKDPQRSRQDLGCEGLGVVPAGECAETCGARAEVEAAKDAAGERMAGLYGLRGAKWWRAPACASAL